MPAGFRSTSEDQDGTECKLRGRSVKTTARVELPADAAGSQIDGERQEGIMAKGNNAQKKETKKPKKGAVKGAADTKKDKKK
jgi:hypothetical protein